MKLYNEAFFVYTQVLKSGDMIHKNAPTENG